MKGDREKPFLLLHKDDFIFLNQPSCTFNEFSVAGGLTPLRSKYLNSSAVAPAYAKLTPFFISSWLWVIFL